MRSIPRTGVIVAMVIGLASRALAQPGAAISTRVSGVFGGSFGTGGATLATGGSAGFQFTRVAGLEFEVSVAPDLEFGGADCNTTITRCAIPLPATQPVFNPFVISSRGRAVNFVANYVAEFPTPARWLRPYVLGGGGVSSVTRRIETTLVTPLILSTEPASSVTFTTVSGLAAIPTRFTAKNTETDLALSSGGGVDFLVGRHFGIGADIRYMHLFGNTDLNLTRVGTRFSVRF